MRGLGIDELVWRSLDRGPFARAFVPVDIFDRPMWRFGFRRRRLGVRQAFRRGLRRPPVGKFLVSRWGSNDSPWGKGMLDEAYWMYYIQSHGWAQWADFIERFASPPPMIGYDQGKEGQRKAAEELGELLMRGEGAAVPKDLLVNLLEATRSGNASYQGFVQAAGRAMTLLILGEVNTSGDRPGTGAFASEKVSDEIRREPRPGDVRFVDRVLCRLYRWITDINFGSDVASPISVCVTEDATRLETRRDGIDRARDAGLDVAEREAREVWQVRKPLPGEALLPSRASDQGNADA